MVCHLQTHQAVVPEDYRLELHADTGCRLIETDSVGGQALFEYRGTGFSALLLVPVEHGNCSNASGLCSDPNSMLALYLSLTAACTVLLYEQADLRLALVCNFLHPTCTVMRRQVGFLTL